MLARRSNCTGNLACESVAAAHIAVVYARGAACRHIPSTSCTDKRSLWHGRHVLQRRARCSTVGRRGWQGAWPTPRTASACVPSTRQSRASSRASACSQQEHCRARAAQGTGRCAADAPVPPAACCAPLPEAQGVLRSARLLFLNRMCVGDCTASPTSAEYADYVSI